jgi:hypothetical protein
MMRSKVMGKLQYLLFAVLLFAMTGCGASNIAGTNNSAPGKITAKFDWAADGKSTAKTVAAVPTGVVSVRLKITGPTVAGVNYTRVKASFPAADGGGSVAVSPGTGLIVVAEALGAGDVILYEGIISSLKDVYGASIAIAVVAGGITDLGTISMAAPIYKVADVPCLGCHEDARAADGNSLVAEYKGSRHYSRTVSPSPSFNGLDYSASTGCAGCHTQNHKDLNPAASGRCFDCHNAAGNFPTFHLGSDGTFTYVQNKCDACHNPHSLAFDKPTEGVAGCTICHAIGQNKGAAYVQDNNGVRAISAEFAKTSHHVTGRAATDTDCAVCHLEGKKVVTESGTAVAVDTAYHMKDNKIYLRNGNTGLAQTPDKSVAGAYPWNPASPDNTLMDQFCFSCHNATGAPAAAAALAGVTGYTGTALNPFGDTVSNDYDQVSRVNVVNAYDQFDTGNSSHHAVRGAKYTNKTLSAAQFTNISTANYNFQLQGVAAPITGTKSYVAMTSTGGAGTMYSLGKFNTLYTTLDGTVLADNMTIHCGDCHTVGQFRAADVGVEPFNKAVIGAHGSGNEYMLRNANGDDTLSKDALVCYNCHNVSDYGDQAGEGSTFLGTVGFRHNNANNANGDCNGSPYNTAGMIGRARLEPKEGAITDAVFQDQVNTGKYAGTGGSNIFGIKCANCHNASDKKTFGGIHGNAGNASYNSYSGAKTASGALQVVSRKPYRFMPGLGNFRYNGGDSADQWTVKTVSSANKQSCYTLNGISTSKSRTTADQAGANISTYGLPGSNDNGILGSWGACTDHAGTSINGGQHDPLRTVLRPLTY